ncbi:hypothetical protein [Natribacillus halophilus]|uniref:Uncharacterized protein n=1 Tax=Natribacillus halophilus TaxID=549003 RepID=A0A1G8Q542_9BACI|nr:hypothetical protein [Natribacillus halophilus]SDI99646.1 hypothetical protein SAMN04488123_110105 [Natribacillus halophilus]
MKKNLKEWVLEAVVQDPWLSQHPPYGHEDGNFHEVDEWINLESIKKVTKVYAEFLARWCGLNPAPT